MKPINENRCGCGNFVNSDNEKCATCIEEEKKNENIPKRRLKLRKVRGKNNRTLRSRNVARALVRQMQAEEAKNGNTQ